MCSVRAKYSVEVELQANRSSRKFGNGREELTMRRAMEALCVVRDKHRRFGAWNVAILIGTWVQSNERNFKLGNLSGKRYGARPWCESTLYLIVSLSSFVAV